MFRVFAGVSLACALAGCSKQPAATTPSQPPKTVAAKQITKKPIPSTTPTDPVPPPEPTPKLTATVKPAPMPPVPEPPQPKPPERDPNKVDFTLTAAEYYAEWKANGDATRKKYAGKVLELTGKVLTCDRDNSTRDLQFAAYEKPTNLTEELTFLAVPLAKSEWEKEQGLKALSYGQIVTLRGIGGNPNTSVFDDMKIVKLGPGTAKPSTLKELAAELKDEAKQKDVERSSVVLRVKVVERAKTDDFFGWRHFCWVVVDADAPNGPQFWLGGHVVHSEFSTAELLALKPGDVVLVMGNPKSASPTPKPSIENAGILKEPPAGVKLPAEKK